MKSIIGNLGKGFVLAGLAMSLPAYSQVNEQSALAAPVGQAEYRQPASRAELDQMLGPLVLTRPLARQTVQFLLTEAESQYRFGNPAQALRGYETIVAVAPEAAKAWLRIGNLHHQAARLSAALEAYRRSADSGDRDDLSSRQKSLTNMLLIHLEGAEKALDRLESESSELMAAQGPPKSDPGAADMESNVREFRGQVLSVQSRGNRRLTQAAKVRHAERM